MKHSTRISVKVGVNIFELRNIEVYDRLSEETTAFTCDIFVNDIWVGTCENSGKGEGNYPRISSKLSWEKRQEEFRKDLEHNRQLYGEVELEVSKHHYHSEPTKDYPRACDWNYDMDFLIAEMVFYAWYYRKAAYHFTDEK